MMNKANNNNGSSSNDNNDKENLSSTTTTTQQDLVQFENQHDESNSSMNIIICQSNDDNDNDDLQQQQQRIANNNNNNDNNTTLEVSLDIDLESSNNDPCLKEKEEESSNKAEVGEEDIISEQQGVVIDDERNNNKSNISNMEHQLDNTVDDDTQQQQSNNNNNNNNNNEYNNIISTIVHFILTYAQWSISLFLFLASITITIPTLNEQVWEPINKLHNIVQTEAELYYNCVNEGFVWQNKHIDRQVQNEQKRLYVTRNNIQQKIQFIQEQTNICTNYTVTAQYALQQWNNNNNSFVVPKLPCNQSELLSIILLEDIHLFENEIYNTLDIYITQSIQSLQNIINYTNERSIYDYNYFIGIKINTIITLLDNYNFPIIFIPFIEADIIGQLRIILQDLLDALHGAYIQIDILTVRLYEFETSIQKFYFNYQELYNRFAKIGIFVKDFIPDGVPLPDYFNISGIPIADDLLPPIFSVPTFDVLPDIDDLISEYIIKAIELITFLLQEAAKEATEQTRIAIEELIQLLKDILTLDDYNPPKYHSTNTNSPEEEIDYIKSLADETNVKIRNAIEELKINYQGMNLLHTDSVLASTTPVSIPNITERNQTDFQFLDLSIPQIKIPMWLFSIFDYFYSYSFIIECITQAIRLYRLKRKYEKNNNTPNNLPEIDYFIGIDNNNEDDKEEKPSMIQIAQTMFIKHLFNPWLLFGFFFIPLVLCILCFWFPHVKATCIDTRNGTFLARNVFKQIQINKANSQGYTLHRTAQSNCQRKQRSICTQKTNEYDTLYRHDKEILFTLQRRYNETITIYNVINDCIDTNELDVQFNTHCCGLMGYLPSNGTCQVDIQEPQFCPIDNMVSPPTSFRPIGELLYNSQCENIDFDIEHPIFNCSVLEETCIDVPCNNGVDATIIEEMTIEADCNVEIYAIQISLFIAIAVYHAIMINIGSALLFSGIIHIRWKHMEKNSDNEIKMLTHITTDGELIKGIDMQERNIRIEQTLNRFVLSGWIQIGLSILIFIFWIITFLLLRKIISTLGFHHE